MEKNKITFSDRKLLISAVDTIVRLHVKYLKLGFTIKSIAQTFSQVYHRQLQQALNSDVDAMNMAKKEMKRENKAYTHLGQEPKHVALSICLALSAAFMGAVSKIIHQNRPR